MLIANPSVTRLRIFEFKCSLWIIINSYNSVLKLLLTTAEITVCEKYDTVIKKKIAALTFICFKRRIIRPSSIKKDTPQTVAATRTSAHARTRMHTRRTISVIVSHNYPPNFRKIKKNFLLNRYSTHSTKLNEIIHHVTIAPFTVQENIMTADVRLQIMASLAVSKQPK
jgi:hypothetical protein